MNLFFLPTTHEGGLMKLFYPPSIQAKFYLPSFCQGRMNNVLFTLPLQRQGNFNGNNFFQSDISHNIDVIQMYPYISNKVYPPMTKSITRTHKSLKSHMLM